MATSFVAMALYALVAGWADSTELPATGKASYYNPGVMETVWENRLRMRMVEPCPECIGGVAMLRQGDLGRKVWIEYKGEVLGPFMVVDCADRKHYQPLVDIGEVVELPHWLAMRWKMAGRIQVTVHEQPPEQTAPATP